MCPSSRSTLHYTLNGRKTKERTPGLVHGTGDVGKNTRNNNTKERLNWNFKETTVTIIRFYQWRSLQDCSPSPPQVKPTHPVHSVLLLPFGFRYFTSLNNECLGSLQSRQVSPTSLELVTLLSFSVFLVYWTLGFGKDPRYRSDPSKGHPSGLTTQISSFSVTLTVP